MHDTMTQLITIDMSDPNSGQIEQNRRSVIQARGLSRLLPQQQQDFKRSRAPHLRRAAHRSKPALPDQDRRAGLYQQMVGRGLRTADGKQDCLVLDAVGVSRQQKLVTLVDMMPSAVYDSSELSTARRRTAGDSSKRTANGTTSTANRRRVRYADVELLPEPSRWARLRVWLSGRLSPAA